MLITGKTKDFFETASSQGEYTGPQPAQENFWLHFAETTGLRQSIVAEMLNGVTVDYAFPDYLCQAFLPKAPIVLSWTPTLPLIIFGVDWRLNPMGWFTDRLQHGAIAKEEMGFYNEDQQRIAYWRFCCIRAVLYSLEKHCSTEDTKARYKFFFGRKVREEVFTEMAHRHLLTTLYASKDPYLCRTSLFLIEHIERLRDVQYCSRRRRIIYKNVLGFTQSVEVNCHCTRDCALKKSFVTKSA